ncbi:hypothetical protein CISIN_1g036821mg [Citrus sinensis]|uniref:Uncharacterized protein n=1 Tax=Citrus sinensis TaxID=2711 RepID=A0A067GE64_CITSI|nr:hypothetical protein CISIN_1g036821mg [Citrus sinensis]
MAGWGKEEKAKRGRKKWKMENLSIRYTKQAHHSCPGANKSRDLSEPIPICESATAYAALESESEPAVVAHEAVSGSPVEAGGFKGLGTRRGEFCDADAVSDRSMLHKFLDSGI